MNMNNRYLMAEHAVMGIVHRQHSYSYYGSLILLLVFIGCEPNPGIPPGENITVAADQVLKALEEFKKTNGRYPEKIEQLVPNYLNPIPTPDWGTRRWEYIVCHDGNIMLQIRLKDNRYERVYYRTETSKWGRDF
ncbi:hypothetical protein L6Q85_09785 [bacterium]|nr:hypothetical protein [bacterium]